MIALRLTFDVPESPSMRKVAQDAAWDGAGRLERALESTWPVETGRSQRAWERQGRPDAWLVVNAAPYAAYVQRRGAVAPIVTLELPAALQRTADEIAQTLAQQLPAAILKEVSHG